MAKRIKKVERAEVNVMWDLIKKKERQLKELEKTDSKESRYKQGAMKRSITKLTDKFCLRCLELLKR